MKKTFNLFTLLVVFGLVLSVVACNKKTEESKTTEKPTTAETDKPTEKPTDAPTDAPTDKPTTEHEHVWNEGVVTTEPTCTEKGVRTYTCECGETRTEEVAALGHTEVVDAAVAPTCTETGKTEGKHCSVCNAVLVAQETIDALGHDYQWIVDKEATVTETGFKHEECTRCHDKKNENTAIEQLNGYELKALGEHKIDVTVIKTETGVKIVYKAAEDDNSFGYGACLDLPGTDYSVLLATTGNIAFQEYGNWLWEYKLPSAVGATVSRELKDEYMISSFEFTDETLGITDETTKIGVLLFEVVNTNGAQFGIYNTQDNIAIDGGVGNFYKFQFAEEKVETPAVTKEFEEFGQSKANIKLEVFSKGVKITINSTPLASTFGYGVMFGNLETNAGTTDLYALGFGTVDHKTYGDWNWQGNYVNPTTVGIQASEVANEDKKTVELFYSFETLSALGITKDTTQFGVQFFEYVTDSSGNLYSVYNCINVDGAPLAFDSGVANFVKITIE